MIGIWKIFQESRLSPWAMIWTWRSSKIFGFGLEPSCKFGGFFRILALALSRDMIFEDIPRLLCFALHASGSRAPVSSGKCSQFLFRESIIRSPGSFPKWISQHRLHFQNHSYSFTFIITAGTSELNDLAGRFFQNNFSVFSFGWTLKKITAMLFQKHSYSFNSVFEMVQSLEKYRYPVPGNFATT